MAEVQREPLVPGAPMGFTVLRVPFFLEPDYSTGEEFEETNRVRLIRKWGGKAGWEEQKRRHGLKERGREVGIQHFNLDRIASSTVASHRLVQWVTKTLGVNKAEQMYADLNSRHFEDGQKLNDKAMLTEVAANVGMSCKPLVVWWQRPEIGRGCPSQPNTGWKLTKSHDLFTIINLQVQIQRRRGAFWTATRG